jgi:hypothetical protein
MHVDHGCLLIDASSSKFIACHPTVATLRLTADFPFPLVLVLAPAARSAFWKSASVKP